MASAKMLHRYFLGGWKWIRDREKIETFYFFVKEDGKIKKMASL
jgi:hypothetical protein